MNHIKRFLLIIIYPFIYCICNIGLFIGYLYDRITNAKQKELDEVKDENNPYPRHLDEMTFPLEYDIKDLVNEDHFFVSIKETKKDLIVNAARLLKYNGSKDYKKVDFDITSDKLLDYALDGGIIKEGEQIIGYSFKRTYDPELLRLIGVINTMHLNSKEI